MGLIGKGENVTARNDSTWVRIQLKNVRRLPRGIRETTGSSKKDEELIGYLWTRGRVDTTDGNVTETDGAR